ncbi:zinc finger, CCHC-type containing protein [Tanacetum coccineum]
MTTSPANNSVFRGFFEKQKLTGPNFIDWYRQLRIVLSIEVKLNYLEQPLPPEIVAAHTAWVKGSKEIAGLMLIKQSRSFFRLREIFTLASMKKGSLLAPLFAQQAEQELLQTTRDFHACKQEEGQSVSSSMRQILICQNNAPAHCIRAGKVQKGHWKRNCPQYLAELLKKKKNTASGAGGGSAVSNAFAIFVFELPCGLVSVGEQLSTMRLLYLRVYFSAIRGHGLFEIDLSNSYTNENSIYTVSNKRAKLDLDSALLWHCRLGHISKKRIEKLQHDGLINSTDLRAFEKMLGP